MTVRDIEQQLIPLIRSLAAAEEGFENLRDHHLDVKAANEDAFGESKRTIAEQKTAMADLNVRLSLAEKEIADLRAIIERGRSNRWAVILSMFGIVASAAVSYLISTFAKAQVMIHRSAGSMARSIINIGHRPFAGQGQPVGNLGQHARPRPPG